MSRMRYTILVLVLLAAACGRGSSGAAQAGGESPDATARADECDGVTLEATDIGVTADTITIQVSADVGSPLAPGLFQGNFDAMKAFAKHVNAEGGIGCRQLRVETWDSKLTPEEAKNGQIDACKTSVALVGSSAIFNPDVTEMNSCPDASGNSIGLPDITAIANDINEQCARNTFSVSEIFDACPGDGSIPSGVRPFTLNTGFVALAQTMEPDLRGMFLVSGDLPTTVQTGTYFMAAQEKAGVHFEQALKVSGRDEQAAFTPRVQAGRSSNVNYVYDGANDTAMINMRREATAQGFEPSLWFCSPACYTKGFKTADGVDGTYTSIPFLPFEDKGSNSELDAYLEGTPTPDAFGASAWAAGVLFAQTVDTVVSEHGPNGVTRMNLLDALGGVTSFDANGWFAPRNPKSGPSDCIVTLQLKSGEFVRAKPTDPGTFDCNTDYLTTVMLDPSAEVVRFN